MTNSAITTLPAVSPSSSLLSDQFIDMKFITQLTGLTDKWFYKLIQDGEFPKPIKLGRSSRWLKSEVEQWLSARIEMSRMS
nr:AlpA family transcriptional regulator [Providencia alcalifaciens]